MEYDSEPDAQEHHLPPAPKIKPGLIDLVFGLY